jgi:ABC-type phosphate/phosphonate transport system substrate-binding protein
MLAVNTQSKVTAHVFVRKGSGIEKFADLKGKELAVPGKTKEHCHLFIERHCQGDASCAPSKFFGQVSKAKNVEAALDDLCYGKVDAVVIDAIGLEFYKDLKPGCFAKLKEIATSDAFVPPVIAYNPASMDAATLAKLRDGLLRAHKTPLGDELMKTWKITSFEPVPANFQQALDKSYKAYPPPEGK